MTRDDVIRMAREAGLMDWALHDRDEKILRFAHLVIADFLQHTGQYVTNDASREAAITEAVAPWKSAVIDQLVMAHILTAEHETDPQKAVQALLAYHADIAVDPRVSGAAAAMVEQAKAEVESAATERANERANASWALMCEKMVAAEREACAKVCESERDALNENLQVWQENPMLTPCDEFISNWDSEAKIGEQYAAAIRARGQK